MFKEVVSLAIILGFVLNILYVDHPDTSSYTVAFVISLLFLSPGVGYMLYRRREKKRREVEEMKAMRAVIAEAGGRSLVGDTEGVERRCCRVGEEVRLLRGGDGAGSEDTDDEEEIDSERDVEKGLVGKKVLAERGEACGSFEVDACHT